jgi:hypothetical protein
MLDPRLNPHVHPLAANSQHEYPIGTFGTPAFAAARAAAVVDSGRSPFGAGEYQQMPIS